jgi:hypothetical protein
LGTLRAQIACKVWFGAEAFDLGEPTARGDFGSAKSAAAADLRQTRRVGGDDWASRTAPSPTERRSKTLFERREIVVGDEPSICRLEGRGRESIAKKYVPDAPAAQISNFKASNSGDGKQHLDLLVQARPPSKQTKGRRFSSIAANGERCGHQRLTCS